jgi:hypothetical protein
LAQAKVILMSVKISGIDVPNTIINLEFRLGMLEQIVTRLATFSPPDAISDEFVTNLRAAVFESLRAKYPDAGLVMTPFGDPQGRSRQQSSETIFLTLHGNSYSGGKLDLILRNGGAPFNILRLKTTTPGAQILQWHPRSLGDEDLLRVPTQLPESKLAECEYEMTVRDRSGVERVFKMSVDPTSTPAGYDFVEVT